MNNAFFDGIQAQVNAMVRKASADAGQWTVGELLIALDPFPENLVVRFSDGSYPGEFMSYRGYYDHVAIDRSPNTKMLGEFRKQVRDVIGQTLEGYKGGSFTMDRYTPVWVSEYGDASGNGVVGVKQEGGFLTVMVKCTERDL